MQQKGIASIIIIAVVLIGVIVGVFLVQNYTSFLPQANSDNASLALSPTTQTTAPGCELNFDILLNTADYETDGTDAILKFDPSVLTITAIQKGEIYPMYPGNTVDNNSGKAVISGLATPSNPFKGSGKLATITVKVKPEISTSEAVINFDFDPNNPYKTNDSNIIEKSTIAELLREVTNATINIDSHVACDGQPHPTSSPSITPSMIPISQPDITVKSLPGNMIKIEWSNLQQANLLDEIQLFHSDKPNGLKKSIGWVYASTCNTVTPDRATAFPKKEGSCSLGISVNQGEIIVKLIQNTAAQSLPLSF